MPFSLDYTRYSTVLDAFLKAFGNSLTVNEIEKKTGLTSVGVKASLLHLRDAGFQIIERDNRCHLVAVPDLISPVLLHCGLKTRVMGREIHAYKTIGSTNEVAHRLAESGAPEGALVVAERQTKGRGRLGRHWYSASGLGLYFSLILRPELDFQRLPALSLVAALSICRIADDYGVTPLIKWPNDCLLNGKKFAGILVEISAELDRVVYVIMGIGININHKPQDLNTQIRSKATSLATEAEKKIDRALFLRAFLTDFERSYSSFRRYGFRIIAPELVKRSAVIGKKVTIQYGKNRVVGTALGFDEFGALRVRVREGVKVFTAGEVSLRK